ncbi:DUF748 domain-containing protein [Limnohabitans sp. T6-20]|uniref:DUF748 domain-containing protein n=1 Tax=Limnohabitans sp. T6-20 TaxID=1100725 RepID=UPI001304E334|nr:DUF748 domain-containing protein [Limnohabitans sp. T6-20]
MYLGLLKRWQRWVLIFVLGVLAMWAISWAALPVLLQWQIEKQGTQALGRAVTVEQVIFRPWSMRLIIRGLRVAHDGSATDAGAGAAAQPAQLSIDEVEVNASLQSLVLWAPVADAVIVRNPQLQLSHRGQGRFDIDDVLARFASTEPKSAGVPRLSLFNIQVTGGGVQFRDAPKGVTHTLSDVRLDIPFLSNIGGRREVATHPRLAFIFDGADFDTDAETTPFAADRHTQAHFQIKDFDVKPYLPYWPAAWPVRLTEGQLELDMRVDFRQQTAPELSVSGHVALRSLKLQVNPNRSNVPLLQLGAVDWKIEDLKPLDGVLKSPQIRVTDVSLGSTGMPDVSWTELKFEEVEVDVSKQLARVGRLGLNRPVLNVSRNPQGRWMFDDWLAQVASTPAPETAPNPWQLDMGPLQIAEGVLTLDDRFVPGGAKLEARDFNASVGAWQPLAASPQMTSVKVDVNIGAQTQRREPGKLGFEGAFRLPSVAAVQGQASPLALKGRLQLTRFPVQRLRSYWSDRVNFDLRRAELSYVGGLDVTMPEAGLGLQLQGNLAVDNLRALNRADGEALLDIQALNLRGIDLGVDAGALKHLKIAETALSDFFARVAIDAQGHLNLQNLVKTDASTPASSASSSASAPSAPSASANAPAVMALGPIGLVNGRVLFSDHFIKPNYSAEITELAGSLGALSNQARQADTALADLALRGRVAGSGRLEVSGRINPLTRPVALDVRGQVRDLELPQLSPYSSKYAGYGIERGKLSAELNYRIGADGQLQATHQIVLNQLRFGERSDSPDAPNLPVKLAVALLADRNGVIDINLPVSGSINDPEFRVGPIVWKMVLNLIGKAILSPFSLIAGAFSGEEQLQQIDFPLGRADLDAASRQKLQSVAQLMIDKPALRLTLSGEANLDSERDAWRKAKLRESVVTEKRRRMTRDAQGDVSVPDVSPEEYPALLQSVYRRSPIPKPRNVLGLVKDLPPADMEALLLAAVSVDETDMRALAQARAQQVREVLVSLKVPTSQLFLGAPVVSKTTPAAPFVPKVGLVVSTD